MSIDSEGRLETSITDDCENYSPDKTKPLGIESNRTGVIFACRNHKIAEDLFSNQKNAKPNACLFCYNWKTPERGYANRIRLVSAEIISISDYKGK